MKVTLLGTGSPLPELARRGPSQVIEVADSLVLVDTGRGCLDRLLEAGYTLDGRRLKVPLRTIAFTHLHSDHVTGLPDLLWAGWIMRWWDKPPQVVGPPGTAEMMSHLFEAFAYDIAVREIGESAPREELIPDVVEVEEGWSSEGDGWRLTGFRVDHAPVEEAFGFRVDGDGGSIVVSGDTRYSENLLKHALGTDILVHEVYSRIGMDRRIQAAAGDPRLEQLAHTISTYHTSSDQVGKIASKAEAKQLVMSHFVFGPAGTPADVHEDASKDYKRPLFIGEDLASFEV
jgi:ribonuclease Z